MSQQQQQLVTRWRCQTCGLVSSIHPCSLLAHTVPGTNSMCPSPPGVTIGWALHQVVDTGDLKSQMVAELGKTEPPPRKINFREFLR